MKGKRLEDAETTEHNAMKQLLVITKK